MLRITSLPQYNRNARRFKEILFVLGRYGLANWLKRTDPKFITELFKSAMGESLVDLPQETRVRMALTELGPTFIKLAQILSTRPDLVGLRLAEELSELQANTPADAPEIVRALLQAELGRPIEDVFESFDDVAIASASIGQVHRGRLHSGEDVVVKIQHDGIGKLVAVDMDILAGLAGLAEGYDPDLRLYQPRAMVAEFSRNILRELDFTRELRNLESFADNFKDDNTVHIPKAYAEFSSKRVLVMEALDGYSVAHVDRLEKDGLDRRVLAERGAKLFLAMIFRHGFYHADPHPGNIWVQKNNVIGLLDCGMAGRLDEATRESVETMLIAAVELDAVQLADIVERVGKMPQNIDRDSLRADVGEMVAEYMGHSLEEVDFSQLIGSVLEIIRRYHIILPARMSMLFKTLVMLEGTSRTLHREFSLAELLEPYCVEAVRRRYTPDRLLRLARRVFRDWNRLGQVFPRDAVEIMARLRAGEFNVNFRLHEMRSTVNRLVYGILTAALFLGSCQILGNKIPPTIWGVSVPGAAGCTYALFLGFRLLRAIKHSGDLVDRP